ncbi:L10-interacting MYB domain-containing protein-like [Bidens hawaiensis]|uniref:L10-interacting MYB domain-containing protein-like n=1 Tax=Bidens hawaiensis TaxID=980011 RepID=UPI00404B693A
MGPKNSDRLRTIWTLEMDRYFIDLMLEQVAKGNRIDDHLFSKRAWKHMTTLFNAKFKFHYEKDVLKNRHKTLRNLYKAVRNLLSLNGFSWDHTRHMVTADNNVWDDYIKGHPDARSYRIKTIPHYYNLCQIYKDVSSETDPENYDKNPMKSLSESVDEDDVFENNNADLEALHEIMIDEEFTVSVSKESEYEDVSGSRVRTCWQPTMDRYFVDLMADQVKNGNQVDGLFRKQAWIEMIKVFNARFGLKYDVDILKNRYKTFRRQFNVINKLLESQGFFWDDLRQMVVADDLAWQDYIEANSDARQYMTRPVPYYKDLCIIFKESDTDENDSSSNNRSTTDADIKRQLENKENPENSKKSRVDEERLLRALQEMTDAVSCLVEKSKLEGEGNQKLIDVENVVAGVQALPDMDDDLILDACDLLEDDKKAKTFLALDVRLRKKWLIRKLRP